MKGLRHLIAGLFLWGVAALSPTGLAAEEVKLAFGDIRLSANLSLAEGKTIKDRVVLITHGTLAHSKMELIGAVQSLLNDAGHSSLAINLGLGAPEREFMYECQTPHRHIFHNAMKEIDAWLGWLASQGTGDVVLFGHSRGGNQTAWFAAENDHALVSKVVLLAPATWDQAQAEKGYRKSHRKPLAEVMARAQALIDQGKGDEMMQKTGMVYCRNATVSAASFVSYYAPDPRRHTPNLLPRITKPTLVMAGSDDTVVPGLENSVPPVLKSDGQRFELIEGAGHFFRDLYAEDVVDLVVEFLDE